MKTYPSIGGELLLPYRFQRYQEGVVCKGGSGHNIWRAKIKTDEWFERLKEVKGDKWNEYY